MLQANQSMDMDQNILAGWSSLKTITTNCMAVQNIMFTAPSPKPVWFDALNAALENAQTVATNWVDNLSVDVTKTIPTAIVDYGTDYAAFSQKIREIAAAHPDASGAGNTYVKEVNALLETLLTALNEILSSVDKVSNGMKTWGQQMQSVHDNLTTGAANIQSAEMEAAIQYLHNIEMQLLSLTKDDSVLLTMWIDEKTKMEDVIHAINAGTDLSSLLDILTMDVANKNWDARMNYSQQLYNMPYEQGKDVTFITHNK